MNRWRAPRFDPPPTTWFILGAVVGLLLAGATLASLAILAALAFLGVIEYLAIIYRRRSI